MVKMRAADQTGAYCWSIREIAWCGVPNLRSWRRRAGGPAEWGLWQHPLQVLFWPKGFTKEELTSNYLALEALSSGPCTLKLILIFKEVCRLEKGLS